MIITLKGADFSASNIGTLSSWRISRSLGSGATYEGATSVDKGAAFSATVTLTEGYEIGTAGVTITMGGVVLSGAHSISGNVITITIAEVTGNVLIKVPTINTATGEEEEPDEPEVLTLDSIAYGDKTYRDIFVNANIAPNINNNSMKAVSGSYTFADSTGTTSIVQVDASETNCVPTYSLYVTGTSSQQARCSWTPSEGFKMFMAANVKVTSYTKGYCGLILGSKFDTCVSEVTNGYVTVSSMQTGNNADNLFIGSASSANLTGYVNNPVVIKMSIFGSTDVPSKEVLTELYNNYTQILRSEQA